MRGVVIARPTTTQGLTPCKEENEAKRRAPRAENRTGFKSLSPKIKVVGAGLAGCEAAWQLAARGIDVELYEMKPEKRSDAHKSPAFAELVCSNSLRGAELATAPGLLKEEMRRLGSLIIEAADRARVPAGGALAVDREGFSGYITEKIKSHPKITVIPGEVEAVPPGPVIIATGPLTAGTLMLSINALCGAPMHFYDAAAPIISAGSVDMQRAFRASRHGKGTDDYINCPLDRDEYQAFVRELAGAEEAEVHGFEDSAVFEGCMPVEVMARRGEDTLRYGPMRPVGLIDPRTGKRPWAVVQLRADNAAGTMLNLVGFQTHLKHPEQRRVFGMIPALARAEYLRYGVMHRNSYIRSPGTLDASYRLIERREIAFAGQITGVEGYIESAASGLVAGLSLAREALGLPPIDFSARTALGALGAHISGYSGRDFQPMNINFGLIEPMQHTAKRKRERHLELSARALEEIDALSSTVLEAVK